MNYKILSADYGTDEERIDVRVKVENALRAFKYIKISNENFGDPQPNKHKNIQIKYLLDGVEFYSTLEERDVFSLDSFKKIDNSKPSVLILFYTNNNINSKILKSSLDAIELIRDTTKSFNVSVVASVWDTIAFNPFKEIPSRIKNLGSLNIIMQIIQGLSYALSLGHQFKYVALAEHDVLYPYNYIESLSEIKNYHNIIVNSNYIGMCEKGFQANELDHLPLHQMVFDFEYALRYFPDLLLSNMHHGHCVIEPQDDRDLWHERFTMHPSVHINHSQNYTSHFVCYSKDKLCVNNYYWGNFKRYYPENENSMIAWDKPSTEERK